MYKLSDLSLSCELAQSLHSDEDTIDWSPSKHLLNNMIVYDNNTCEYNFRRS